MSHYLKFAQDMLIEKHALPADFRFYRWQRKGEHHETWGTELWGVCCPLVKTGKRKGRENWRAKRKETERSFIVFDHEIKAIEKAFEQSTGKCAKCRGDGKEVWKIDFVKGETTYRPCGKCKGSGMAVLEAVE